MSANTQHSMAAGYLSEIGVPGEPVGSFEFRDGVERGHTLADQVYRHVRRGLLLGGWVPGARLSMRQIAIELGISVTPVREALLRLISEGALEAVANGSIHAPVLRQGDYEEIVRIRSALEPMAGEIAAQMITPVEIDDLYTRNEWLKTILLEDKLKEALPVDTGFHLAIYRAARQPLLLSMIESLLTRAGPTRTRLPGIYRKSMVGYRHHRRILEALRAHDGTAVRQEIASDLADGSAELLRVLYP